LCEERDHELGECCARSLARDDVVRIGHRAAALYYRLVLACPARSAPDERRYDPGDAPRSP
jgi:hypothetical protein